MDEIAAERHEDAAAASGRRLAGPAVRADFPSPPAIPDRRSGIAIVGMSAILPKAATLRTYWENILNKVNAIVEIPNDRWDWRLYFDPDPKAPDRIYSRWGGFIDDVTFDPVEFGMPPSSLQSIDPMQLLALRAARLAMEDAGYAERPFDRERASVILGASGGTGDLGTRYVLRASLPLLLGDAASDVIARADGALPEWTEDSFAGLLPNVGAGRISNRFDFGGMNYVVDAACASSLAAVHVAVKELETSSTDLVVAGGFDTTQNPFGYLCFSKTRALSPTGQSRTFDAAADGIAIGEGVVMLVLKRLVDAERDGDRIYAVIRAVEGSSDGRAKGLTAPRPEGQILALERTYARAGVSPTTVGLFEAHGTGTVVGDHAEALALSTFLDKAGAAPRTSAIGSVKSMIGHTKAAAGVASLAKAALALYHKVLPPTLGVTQPNRSARLGDGPLYVNSETRPWIHATSTHPRRAGVSAFGFGGTNFHALLEEHTSGTASPAMALERWPSEVFFWSAPSRLELSDRIGVLARALERGARPDPASLAHSLWRLASSGPAGAGGARERLAIVAGSLEDLRDKLQRALAALAGGAAEALEAGSIYLASAVGDRGRVAFLFPGEGSAYPNMLRDLAVMFPEVRTEFERADRILGERSGRPLSHYIFPPPAFDPGEEAAQRDALSTPDLARPALGAASAALCQLLETLGVVPDVLAGHGHGESAALLVAGILDLATFLALPPAGEPVPARALGAPRYPVLSGATGVPYPSDPRSLAILLAEPATHPLDLADRIEQLYGEGARVFVEVGPSDALTAQVRRMLGERPHLAIAVDAPGHSGLGALQHTLARLFAAGVPVDLDRLFRGRSVRTLDLSRIEEESAEQPLAATTWLVNGSRARPARSVAAPSPAPAPPGGGAAPAVVAGTTEDSRAAGGEPAPATPARSAPENNGAPAASAVPGPRGSSAPLSRAAERGNDGGLAAPRPDAEAGQVMLEFQRLMNRFLETQHNVMTAFLHGRPGSPGGSASPPGQPSATAPEGSTLAAHPGPREPRDTVPVRRPGTTEAASPSDPIRNPRPTTAVRPAEAIVPVGVARTAASPAPASLERLTQGLIDIVSERTGYPAEMLDLDADLEADLGIDSIKRVEILGSLQRSPIAGDFPAMRDGMEELARVKTLRGIVQWVERAMGAGTPGGAAGPVVAAGARGGKPSGGGPLPLLQGATISAGADGVDVIRRLEPSHDLYLGDHVLDGKPVLPAAMALELIAEVAQAGWPHLTFVGLSDVRLLRGIVLDGGALDLRVEARALPPSADDPSRLDVRVEIRDAQGPARPYYRGTANLAPAPLEAPVHHPTLIEGLEPFPLPLDEAYRRWLFHGPLLQGIVEIRGISERGVVATCRPSSPAECLAGGLPGHWLMDPVACDSGLQLILLWARARHDMTTLPSYLSRYWRFRPLGAEAGTLGCHIQSQVLRDGHVVRSTMAFVLADGRVAGLFEGLECTGSPAFNRLVGGHLRPSGNRGAR